MTGSVGEGIADRHSALGLIAYYDVVPPAAAPPPGEFTRHGVACQVGCIQVGRVEQLVAELATGANPDSPARQKTAIGLLYGLPLREGGLSAGWRACVAAFPPAQAEAMARHRLRIFPCRAVQGVLAAGDARLFERQALVEGGLRVPGALSAANGLYFTTLQVKRMRGLIAPDGGCAAAPGRAAGIRLRGGRPSGGGRSPTAGD